MISYPYDKKKADAIRKHSEWREKHLDKILIALYFLFLFLCALIVLLKGQ